MMTTPTAMKPADPLALLRTRRYVALLVLAAHWCFAAPGSMTRSTNCLNLVTAKTIVRGFLVPSCPGPSPVTGI